MCVLWPWRIVCVANDVPQGRIYEYWSRPECPTKCRLTRSSPAFHNTWQHVMLYFHLPVQRIHSSAQDGECYDCLPAHGSYPLLIFKFREILYRIYTLTFNLKLNFRPYRFNWGLNWSLWHKQAVKFTSWDQIMMDTELSFNFYKTLASDANKEATTWFCQILIKIRQQSNFSKTIRYHISLKLIFPFSSRCTPTDGEFLGRFFFQTSPCRKRKSMFYPHKHRSLCKT